MDRDEEEESEEEDDEEEEEGSESPDEDKDEDLEVSICETHWKPLKVLQNHTVKTPAGFLQHYLIKFWTSWLYTACIVEIFVVV